MEWRKPRDGEERQRSGFLIFPKGDRVMKWLVYAEWIEVYRSGLIIFDGMWLFERWT